MFNDKTGNGDVFGLNDMDFFIQDALHGKEKNPKRVHGKACFKKLIEFALVPLIMMMNPFRDR